MEHLVFECQSPHHQAFRAENFPTGLLDSAAPLPPLTRNTLLVPYDGEGRAWRERTHDSRMLSGFET